jgi:hypothetical protein
MMPSLTLVLAVVLVYLLVNGRILAAAVLALLALPGVLLAARRQR